MPLEEFAADDLSHGGHLLLLQRVRRDTGVEVIQQLAGGRTERGETDRSMNGRVQTREIKTAIEKGKGEKSRMSQEGR